MATPANQPSSATIPASFDQGFQFFLNSGMKPKPVRCRSVIGPACHYSSSQGLEQKVNCFSMVLGYSRVQYIELTPAYDIQTFLTCHLHAFEYFDGVTEVILYDNLKSVVLKWKYPSTASEFHPAFVDLKDHFEFTARLCRVYRPKTKDKVERPIGYVKDKFLYGREFVSHTDLNNCARERLDDINNKVQGDNPRDLV